MQFVTIYPNIYEYVSDYMKIHHDRFRTFCEHFANEVRWLRINKTKWEQFLTKTHIVHMYGWYRFLFDRNDYHADRFQIVHDCSISSIVNNRLLKWEFGFIAPSHLTECRRTKGDEWENCTKCTRIQRIQTEFPSSHAISHYCQILSTNDKRKINITCEGYRFSVHLFE